MTTSTNPRSPKVLKGALVGLANGLIGPIPNVVIFQYNPEQLSRSLDIYDPPAARPATEQRAQEGPDDKNTPAGSSPYDPTESISLSLEFDAADALEDPGSHPIAVVTGVADRLAALEQLLYPEGSSVLDGLMGDVSVSVSAGGGGASASASAGGKVESPKRKSATPVLFVWGPGKIYPVRITSYSVEEQAFSPILYPIRAKVSLNMKIVKPDEVDNSTDKVIVSEIMKFTYKFYRTQQQALAVANVANTVESVLGMLPF